MNTTLRTLITPLFQPLMFAAYAAWAAVWLGTVATLTRRDPLLGAWAQGLLLLFLLGWVSAIVVRDLGYLKLFVPAAAVAMLVSLAIMLLGPSGASPILLVLVAILFAGSMQARPLVAMLLAINMTALLIMRFVWDQPWSSVSIQLLALLGFQAFAVLVLRYADRAETMAEQLRQVNAELLATRSLLVESTRDGERLRLSRELHDLSGHKLTALKLNLRALAARTPALGADALLSQACDITDELLTDIRAVVKQLRQHDGVDLTLALPRLVDMFPQPRLHLDLNPEARVPDAQIAETLLRIAQEGLANAARHGNARNAWLRLHSDGRTLSLCLDDDGRVRWPLKPGVGLSSMRERLQPYSGELILEPSQRGGLRLCARLPLESSA